MKYKLGTVYIRFILQCILLNMTKTKANSDIKISLII